MEIKRSYDNCNNIYNYEFTKDNDRLVISFEGNLDLYFTIYSQDINDNKSPDFVITKENSFIYNLFDKLYGDIKNINLFDGKIQIPAYIDTEEEKEEYLRERQKEIDDEKNRYRLHNASNYNELFDDNNKTITWYSDETNSKVSNILRIKKEEDKFILNFYTQPHIEGYDRDFNSKYSISIRFRNSGSKYKPFNICFMRLFNNLQNYDPDYHQITIEEYNYKRKILINEINKGTIL